jgi:hypothetical protein
MYTVTCAARRAFALGTSRFSEQLPLPEVVQDPEKKNTLTLKFLISILERASDLR